MMRAGAILAVALLLAGCDVHLACLTSSIGWGTPGGGSPGQNVNGSVCERVEGKLQSYRAWTWFGQLPGSTAYLWTQPDPVHPPTGQPYFARATCDPAGGPPCPPTCSKAWVAAGLCRALPRLWPDAPVALPPGMPFVRAVTTTGPDDASGTVPHIILEWLGLNDCVIHGRSAAETFAAKQALHAELRTLRTSVNGTLRQPFVLVATELTANCRCAGVCPTCDLPYIHALNALLRGAYGSTKYPAPVLLDLDAAFTARGGTVGPDCVHLTDPMMDLVAEIVTDRLVSLGFGTRR